MALRMRNDGLLELRVAGEVYPLVSLLQPIATLGAGGAQTLVGMEALLRTTHPDDLRYNDLVQHARAAGHTQRDFDLAVYELHAITAQRLIPMLPAGVPLALNANRSIASDWEALETVAALFTGLPFTVELEVSELIMGDQREDLHLMETLRHCWPFGLVWDDRHSFDTRPVATARRRRMLEYFTKFKVHMGYLWSIVDGATTPNQLEGVAELLREEVAWLKGESSSGVAVALEGVKSPTYVRAVLYLDRQPGLKGRVAAQGLSERVMASAEGIEGLQRFPMRFAMKQEGYVLESVCHGRPVPHSWQAPAVDGKDPWSGADARDQTLAVDPETVFLGLRDRFRRAYSDGRLDEAAVVVDEMRDRSRADEWDAATQVTIRRFAAKTYFHLGRGDDCERELAKGRQIARAVAHRPGSPDWLELGFLEAHLDHLDARLCYHRGDFQDALYALMSGSTRVDELKAYSAGRTGVRGSVRPADGWNANDLPVLEAMLLLGQARLFAETGFPEQVRIRGWIEEAMRLCNGANSSAARAQEAFAALLRARVERYRGDARSAAEYANDALMRYHDLEMTRGVLRAERELAEAHLFSFERAAMATAAARDGAFTALGNILAENIQTCARCNNGPSVGEAGLGLGEMWLARVGVELVADPQGQRTEVFGGWLRKAERHLSNAKDALASDRDRNYLVLHRVALGELELDAAVAHLRGDMHMVREVAAKYQQLAEIPANQCEMVLGFLQAPSDSAELSCVRVRLGSWWLDWLTGGKPARPESRAPFAPHPRRGRRAPECDSLGS